METTMTRHEKVKKKRCIPRGRGGDLRNRLTKPLNLATGYTILTPHTIVPVLLDRDTIERMRPDTPHTIVPVLLDRDTIERMRPDIQGVWKLQSSRIYARFTVEATVEREECVRSGLFELPKTRTSFQPEWVS